MMSEILLRFGFLPIYTESFFVVLAFFWFAFILFKKGVEYHYHENDLLDFGIVSGVFGFLFARVFFVMAHLNIFSANWLRMILLSAYPGYNFVGLLIGLIVAVLYIARKAEMKVFDAFDLVAVALPVAISLERIGKFLAVGGQMWWGVVPVLLVQALISLVAFVVLWKLENEYRTFEWYRFRKTQARSGFVLGSFLISLLPICLLEAYVQSWDLPKLIFGVVLAVLGIVVVYLRSGRSVNHDFKLILKPLKVYTSSNVSQKSS